MRTSAVACSNGMGALRHAAAAVRQARADEFLCNSIYDMYFRRASPFFSRAVPQVAGSRWLQALVQNPQPVPCGELCLDELAILQGPVAVRSE
jgi:hypothetical protein